MDHKICPLATLGHIRILFITRWIVFQSSRDATMMKDRGKFKQSKTETQEKQDESPNIRRESTKAPTGKRKENVKGRKYDDEDNDDGKNMKKTKKLNDKRRVWTSKKLPGGEEERGKWNRKLRKGQWETLKEERSTRSFQAAFILGFPDWGPGLLELEIWMPSRVLR